MAVSSGFRVTILYYVLEFKQLMGLFCCHWESDYCEFHERCDIFNKLKLNSVAFSLQANYTDRAAAACWRS
jgi:hypothetical protein